MSARALKLKTIPFAVTLLLLAAGGVSQARDLVTVKAAYPSPNIEYFPAFFAKQ